jgi:spore cortex formation protein SpoVR/YcgB (stage V sporulation)
MDHPAATQAEAEQVCADNLGHLAFFKNEAEFKEYFKETSENNEWLGKIYKNIEGCFDMHLRNHKK